MRVTGKVALTCPRCGTTRLLFPSTIAKYRSAVCQPCKMAAKVSITCSACGQTKTLRQSEAAQRKSTLCKHCVIVARNKANAKHGLESHPLYVMWANIKKRLQNPVGKSRTYAGLDIDPEWGDVRNFVTWALGAGWEPGLSIERRDNSKGYWPSNCCFIPVAHQARNRSNNSITPVVAAEVQARVAAGEVRYRVAKSVAAQRGIPLSTVIKVAYGYNWRGGGPAGS